VKIIVNRVVAGAPAIMVTTPSAMIVLHGDYQNVLTLMLITMVCAEIAIMVNRGLGDTVSSIIRNVSRGKIKECGGCKKRKQWLNENVSYAKVGKILEDLSNRQMSKGATNG